MEPDAASTQDTGPQTEPLLVHLEGLSGPSNLQSLPHIGTRSTDSQATGASHRAIARFRGAASSAGPSASRGACRRSRRPVAGQPGAASTPTADQENKQPAHIRYLGRLCCFCRLGLFPNPLGIERVGVCTRSRRMDRLVLAAWAWAPQGVASGWGRGGDLNCPIHSQQS